MKSKMFITSVIIFFLGTATGVFLDRIAFGKKPPHDPKKIKEKMLNRFTKKLSLTKEQQAQISIILDTHLESADKMRQHVKEETMNRREAMRKEVREHLTPEQQEKFNEMDRKWYKKYKSKQP